VAFVVGGVGGFAGDRGGPRPPAADTYRVEAPAEIAPTEIVCPAGATVVRPVPKAVGDRVFSFVRLLDRGWADAARLAAAPGSPASRAAYENELADIALISVGERSCRFGRSDRIHLTIEVLVRRVLNSRWPETQQTIYVTMQRIAGAWRVYAFDQRPPR
jgi:hypothetical protein